MDLIEGGCQNLEDIKRSTPLCLDISSLNSIYAEDSKSHRKQKEVLIELPSPKCFLNGHGNYDYDNDERVELAFHQEEYLLRDDGDETETKPFLNTQKTHAEVKSLHSRSSTVSDSLNTSSSVSSTLVSPAVFPAKKPSPATSVDSVENSGSETDVDVEPESSTHLLKMSEVKDPDYISSPKVLKSKTKLTSFRSSPMATDMRSHIQHRPLGRHPPDSDRPFRLSSLLKPSWPAVRFGCLPVIASFFVVLSCLMVGAFIAKPIQCEHRHQWWQRSVTYEIFPASFQDTDGDGFGDFAGVISRLDYVQNLSVGIVRLNSVFSALDYPLEYEHVIDFSNVDPHLGRMDDFDDLIREVHGRGMKLVLDLNPSVTSDQHTWAAHWLLHRPGRYENFYINASDNEEERPLEMLETDDNQERTTPHRTFGSQLHLNWSNPLVWAEMLDVLNLWLGKGVDGFYLKHIEDMRSSTNEQLSVIFHQWRFVADRFSANASRRVLMTSHHSLQTIQSRGDSSGFDSIVPLFDVVDAKLEVAVNRTPDIKQQISQVHEWISQFPVFPSIAWHVGSVETSRLASRVGDSFYEATLFLVSVLPGSFSVFYGDEIGMMDSFDVLSHREFRGGQLAPMQWNGFPQANFTFPNSSPWLPVHPDFSAVNAESRSQDVSILSYLVKLKNDTSPEPNPGSSLMGSLFTRIRSTASDLLPSSNQATNYRILRATPTSLLLLETTPAPDLRYLLCANFGPKGIRWSPRKREGDDQDQDPWDYNEGLQVDILLSTNSNTKSGRLELRDVELESGEAFIARIST